MLARNSGGLCGSILRYCFDSSRRRLVRQQCAQLRKSRCRAGDVLDRRRRLLAERDQVRLVADGQAAEVADVLADGEAAVDVLAGQLARLERVVLLDQRGGLHLEGGLVVRGPPVVQVALAVVLRALVVEAVADLVADHRSDAAVVLGRVGVRAEERLLQDPGREADLVGAGVVVGVDGLRQHEPLVTVDRRPDLRQLPVGLERRTGRHVADQVVGAHGQLRVVAELVGVADLGPETVELVEGPLLGLLRHPVQVGDRVAVRRQQVRDQLVHQLLGARREVPGDVLLADRLADHALDQRHAALPAGPQLRGAGQGAAVEVEVGLDEVVGEVRRRRPQDAGQQPRLPVVDVELVQHRRQVLDVRRLADDDLGERRVRAAEVADVGVPVERRGQRRAARRRSSGCRSSGRRGSRCAPSGRRPGGCPSRGPSRPRPGRSRRTARRPARPAG